MSEPRVVTVEIAGQRYPISSSLDTAYVAELAAYVERKLKLASDTAPERDLLSQAMIVALNIADEFFRLQRQRSSSETWPQMAQGRVFARIALIAPARASASGSGVRSRWKASRSAVRGPTPGSRERASISRSTELGSASPLLTPSKPHEVPCRDRARRTE